MRQFVDKWMVTRQLYIGMMIQLAVNEGMSSLNQHETPLFTALVQHAANNPIQFHIPGHKKGQGIDQEFRDFVGENILSIDQINIVPLDDLHQPEGVIKEAQLLAAQAFGADYSFFSVQGTSTPIMTMIMSVCSEGDKIIIPRNVHKSILTAIILSGAIPVFISPHKDLKLGIEHGVTIQTVKLALESHPDAKAVLIINPTYYGVSVQLKEMVRLVHSYNIPVLVDEAHGTLIHFHENLPLSAMEAGADMAATSVHKLGGSLTQSSILNVKGELINIQRVKTVLSMLTTTSTSYILLASLDTARRQLVFRGRYMAGQALELASFARKEINKIPGLYCFGEEILGSEAAYSYDATKLCIHVRKLGITGYEAEKWLRKNYNIEVELSDLYNILCLVTIGDTAVNIETLINALGHMCQIGREIASHEVVTKKILIPELSTLNISPRQAFYSKTESVRLEDSVERIMAEVVYVYPPGIPILIPGEIITCEIIDYITQHLEVGLPVKGTEDPTVRNIKVVKV